VMINAHQTKHLVSKKHDTLLSSQTTDCSAILTEELIHSFRLSRRNPSILTQPRPLPQIRFPFPESPGKEFEFPKETPPAPLKKGTETVNEIHQGERIEDRHQNQNTGPATRSTLHTPTPTHKSAVRRSFAARQRPVR